MSMMDEARPSTPGPTFEDLTFDDNLADIDRIVQYSCSPIALQRLVHVKIITNVAKFIPFEEVQKKILPLLPVLARDEEFIVRQHVAEQIAGLATVLAKEATGAGYRAVIDTLLPQLERLVADAQPEVRIAAGEALVAIADLVTVADLGERVLTIAIRLAKKDDKDDLRTTAAVLMNELAGTLGPTLCQQFVVPEICYLAQDPVFRVRKAAALNLDSICRAVGPAVASADLLPAFLRLAEDAMHTVRRACAESLVSVSKALAPSARVEHLVPVLETLAADTSRWVRASAFQHLGAFIATLAPTDIPDKLLHLYASMAPDLPRGQVVPSGSNNASSGMQPAAPGAVSQMSGAGAGVMSAADAELTVFCAFNFPAVCLAVGRERWKDVLRPIFIRLCKHPKIQVRRPLAYAMHELARIVGPDIAEVDLCGLFDVYRKDTEEVRSGVVRHLAAFLGALSPACRESYLPVLEEVLQESSPLKWRARLDMAAQIHTLAHIFSPAATFSVVVPFAQRLLADPVADVREAAAALLPPLLRRLGNADVSFRSAVEQRLLGLATSPKSKQRRLFVHVAMAEAGAASDDGASREHFCSAFLPPLLRLASDRVVNVRLLLARRLTVAVNCAVSRAKSGRPVADGADEEDETAEASSGPSSGSSGTANTALKVQASPSILERATAATITAAASGGGNADGSMSTSKPADHTRAHQVNQTPWVPSTSRLGWLVSVESLLPAIRRLAEDIDAEVAAEAKRALPGASALGPSSRDASCGAGARAAVAPPSLPGAGGSADPGATARADSGTASSSGTPASPQDSADSAIPSSGEATLIADVKTSIDLSIEAPTDDARPSAAVIRAADQLDENPALLRRSTPRPDEDEAEDGARGSGLVSLEHLADDPSEREEAVLGIAEEGGATAVGPLSRPRALSASLAATGSATIVDEDDSPMDELLAVQDTARLESYDTTEHKDTAASSSHIGGHARKRSEGSAVAGTGGTAESEDEDGDGDSHGDGDGDGDGDGHGAAEGTADHVTVNGSTHGATGSAAESVQLPDSESANKGDTVPTDICEAERDASPADDANQ